MLFPESQYETDVSLETLSSRNVAREEQEMKTTTTLFYYSSIFLFDRMFDVYRMSVNPSKKTIRFIVS